MVGIGQRHDACPFALDLLKCEVHGLYPNGLAKTSMAIQSQKRAMVDVCSDFGTRHQPLFKDGIDVARRHPHTVGIVPT